MASSSAKIRVALAMISELDRMAWTIVIGGQEDMKLVAVAADRGQLTAALDSQAPDVLVVDEELVRACDGRQNSCRVILVSMHRPDYSMGGCQDAFVSRRLLKGISASDLLDAIRATAMEAAQARRG